MRSNQRADIIFENRLGLLSLRYLALRFLALQGPGLYDMNDVLGA